jgi:hypothetical protein
VQPVRLPVQRGHTQGACAFLSAQWPVGGASDESRTDALQSPARKQILSVADGWIELAAESQPRHDGGTPRHRAKGTSAG